MNRHPISADKLAAVYGVTGERVRQLVQQFGFAIVSDPEALYRALLTHGNAGKFRGRLEQVANREQWAAQINDLSKS